MYVSILMLTYGSGSYVSGAFLCNQERTGVKMSSETAAVKRQAGTVRVRKMTMTGLLSAIAYLLMFFEFSVPLMPAFIKMDLSELPALIGSFAMGPVAGVAVCLIKNILHLMNTTTGGVGELSNFVLGAVFVFTAGSIYRKFNTRRGALTGSLIGAAAMAVISVFSNYFIVYPVYTAFMPMETIIAAYQAINAGIENLWQALVLFNMPFTFVKALFSVAITFIVYKRISPVIKGSF